MALPPNYSGTPGIEQHKYFRNVLIEFKKKINESNNIDELQYEMQRLLDASKNVEWPPTDERTDVFHKDEIEKALQKVWNEFKRYIEMLTNSPATAQTTDLFEAIAIVETFIEKLKVR